MARIHVLTLEKYHENPCVIFDKFTFEDLLDLETNLMLYNKNLIVEDYYHLNLIEKPMKPVDVSLEGAMKSMEPGDEGVLKFIKIHKSELKDYLWAPIYVRNMIKRAIGYKKHGIFHEVPMAGFIIHKDLLDNDIIKNEIKEAEESYDSYYKK